MGLKSRINAFWEKYMEPDTERYPPLCQESREMYKQCVVQSDCFKDTEDFRRCAQEDINVECIPLRIDLFRCKRFMTDRTKDFRKDPRHDVNG